MMLTMNHSQENFAPGQHFERANRRIADLPSNMRATRAGEDTLELGPHFQPGSFDVICARGNKAYQHVGNQRYRYMIESRMEQYASASNKFEKSLIVTQIVDEVRQASPGGGFVRYENGRWHEIGDHVAREKVGQSFRDQLHSKYRSSRTAKKLRKQGNTPPSQVNDYRSDATSDKDKARNFHEDEQVSLVRRTMHHGAGMSNPHDRALQDTEPVRHGPTMGFPSYPEAVTQIHDPIPLSSQSASTDLPLPDLSFLLQVLQDSRPGSSESTRPDDTTSTDPTKSGA